MAAPTDKFREALIAALPPLRRFALVLTRADVEADDLLQATCERALSRWEQFKPETRMESWLFSIMHSIWKNLARKNANRARVHDELSHRPNFEDGDRIVSGKIAVTEVLSHLKTMDQDQAAALTLIGLEGLSYREASQVLEIPQGTLESRVARGRIALARLLNQTDEIGREPAEPTPALQPSARSGVNGMASKGNAQ